MCWYKILSRNSDFNIYKHYCKKFQNISIEMREYYEYDGD